MGMRKRTAVRFQLEASEVRLAPGGVPGGVVANGISRSSGEEISQVVHVAPWWPRGAWRFTLGHTTA
jgi:hypothetical protein